ncbi:MAG TPA: hypothetical protein VFS44_15825 [Gemmatimonadaceae bacterium]|nr:hypothetical protein [Gemmatimonadaceae bacterium]
MNARRTAIACSLALGALGVLDASAAQAQGKNQKGGDDKCAIDFGSSDQVRKAYNNLTVLQLGAGKNPDDAKKKLRDAVSGLTTNPDRIKDQQARNFALGQALVAWADLPGQPPVAKRGDLGYATDPNGTIDILAAADTAFRAVEQANPDCADKTGVFRQQAWAPMINAIGPLINDNKVDSAEAVLDRSLVIYRGSPFSYYFKGQIAQRKEKWADASAAYQKSVELATPELAQKDSNVANIREYSEFAAAYSALRDAQAQSGAQQQAGMKKAADLYRAYLKDNPNGPNAKQAQAGLSVSLQASGDTASLGQMWSDMVANPSRYTDAQLFDAGTQAFSANNIKMAVQLMALGEQANPWLRGGLFNLANAYWKDNQFDKMLPVTRKLLEIDPDNPDNYQLVAIAYQGQAKATKDLKAKRALNDSVSKYVIAGEKLPVRVSFTEFTHDSSKAKLVGSVENLGTAAKSSTLTVQFLDKGGNVVATQSAPIKVDPKKTQDFTLTADGQNIVAFRYAPVK